MIYILKKYRFIGLLSFLLLLLIACEKDDNNAYIYGTNSVVNHLENDPEYSDFVEAIHQAGLYHTLDGNSGSYTVFAPDNQAVQAYLSENNLGSLSDLSETEIQRLVNYHILSVLMSSDAFITGYSPTLAAVPINDSVDANLSLFVKNMIDEVKFNGTTEITTADIPVDNGLVHKINHVLAPPTLKIFMEADDNLKAYYQKITASGISTDFEELLSNPEKRSTILVPNEFAVESFFTDQGSALSDEELNRLYNYHLLDTVRLIQNLSSGYLPTKAKENYSGQYHKMDLYLNLETGMNLNGDTGIVISDLMTINGNIQVLDQVLDFPTVVTFIKSDSRLLQFREALSDSLQENQNYLGLLKEKTDQGNAPFTVFAPDNQAFQDLFEPDLPEEGDDDQEDEDDFDIETNGLLDEDIDEEAMTDILNLHIAPNLSLRKEAFTNQSISTLGDPVNLDANQLQLIDPSGETSGIYETNLQTSNGVIHLIDRVLRVSE